MLFESSALVDRRCAAAVTTTSIAPLLLVVTVPTRSESGDYYTSRAATAFS
jgi:hypothetical protein